MRKTFVIAICAVALVAEACGASGEPGVKTSSVQTDIVFDAAKAKVGPLQNPGAPTTGASSVAPLFPEPFQNKVPDRFKNVRFGLSPQQANAECPAAPVGSAPDHAAPENATTPPKAGLYRYHRSGTEKRTVNGGTFTQTYSGFDPHLLRNVESTSPKKWQYDEFEPSSDGVRVTTWAVNTEATQRTVSPPYLGENPVRAGEPGNGVALVAIREFDGNGNERSSFTPSTPILFLPLPVLQGESFSSVGVDPKTGQSLRIDGEAQKRQTVDACGVLLDGWFVAATITESRDGTAFTHHDELVISTDRGGQVISRRTQQTLDTGTGPIDVDLTTSIGQVDPSADPQGAK